MSIRFARKVEGLLSNLDYVKAVKKSSSGKNAGPVRTGKDKCTSDRLLDESMAAVLDVGECIQPHSQASIDYAISELRIMRGHLKTATDGNIRGRLKVSANGELAVGSSVSARSICKVDRVGREDALPRDGLPP